FHIIPIIRLATESDYFNTSVWRKPSESDVVDFANFLNSLNWPVKNRYVIIFNEVNRGDEWGGNSNPEEYARILSLAVDTFKFRSDDFFVISAGLDNAAPDAPNKYINEYNFMSKMDESVPGIFSKIDGLGSHSYPNPGFSQPPWLVTDKSISSFKFEKDLAYNLSGKDLSVFITETGWSKNKLSESQIAVYFRYAFESVWSEKNIVAVTPFLLKAGGEPFSQFSLLNENGDYNEISTTLKKMPKIKGEPTINADHPSSFIEEKVNIPFKKFPQEYQYEDKSVAKTQAIKPFLKWLLKIQD
ncbi:MAG: hypothetical protein Q7R51_01865, partial [bacterium]|nr:hypothetical protein [bacterium]